MFNYHYLIPWGSFRGRQEEKWGSFRGRDHFGGCTVLALEFCHWEWNKHFVTMISQDITYFLGCRRNVGQCFKHLVVSLLSMFIQHMQDYFLCVNIQWCKETVKRVCKYTHIPSILPTGQHHTQFSCLAHQEMTRNEQGDMSAWSRCMVSLSDNGLVLCF